jgi:hypothetical protein
VIQGTLDDARWYSYGVNKSHGLRRTNEDKERAVRTALLHPKATGLSNVQIADHCGVNEKTVRKYRQQSELTSEVPKSNAPAPVQEPDACPPSAALIAGQTEDTGDRIVSESGDTRPRSGRDGRTINTANIGRRRRDVKPNGRGSLKPFQPVREAVPMEKMTALSMPHNPAMGAMALINVFDKQYLRSLVLEITRYLKEDEA